jgi:hypothetical protein
MKQGTKKWDDDRLGKITASRFGDVLTRGRGKDAEFGKTAMTYAYEIVAQKLTGEKKPEVTSSSLEWGKRWELKARLFYQRKTFRLVKETGYIALDDDVGGSPDGLISDDGGLEIKCPYNSAIHLSTLLKRIVPKEYVPQVQGYMWVTEREWWDFASFDPRYQKDADKMVIVRVQRDDKFIEELSERVDKFKEIIDNILCSVRG